MALSAGTRLGPYEILVAIGAGGMGEVYRARDPRLGRDVAIKVLPEHLSKDPQALARFEREAKAVAVLSHPNILAIHDFGAEQGFSYAVTELLEGETLRSRSGRAALAWRKAVEIGVAVADGLSAAHSKGIIHRDLKPENIFLTSDGRVKILDFGLARVGVGGRGPGVGDAEPTVTEPGSVMGTVGYMSPEQVRGERADAPSDIFSLGCVLYEMVVGRRAFARETAAQTMAAILESQPPELRDSGKQIPAELDRLITHCLEKNPQERFHSAHDLGFALRAIIGTSSTAGLLAGRKRLPRPVWIGAALALALLLAGAVLYWLYGSGKAIDSLAVLPFVNVGADPNAEYLSDGITENLINTLSQLPKLRVVPRSLAFSYKGREIDPRKVGRDLNVRAVLMGRVVQRGDSLNIQTELVDVTEVSQLWGQQYNRKLSDLIVIQEEISKAVSEKLRLRPTGEEQKRLAKRSTENPEAHQLYLKGRYLWNRRTAQTLQRAAQYFQEAIDKDPGYALAWAGLADCYALYSFYSALSPKEAFPRAKEAAAKALEIDDTLAEAHATLIWVKISYDWDWPGAEREFKRAVELNPNYATTYNFIQAHRIAMGRPEEAVALAKRAEELEPFSLILSAIAGRNLYHVRQYDEAIEQLRGVIDRDANFPQAHLYLGWAYEQKGRFEEAIAEFQKGSSLSGGEPTMTGALGHAYAVSGRRDRAQSVLVELKQLMKRRYVAPLEIAVIYIGLGDQEQAFEWLEKAYQDHSHWLIWLKVDPRFDSIHGDSRYRDLRQRMGLPP